MSSRFEPARVMPAENTVWPTTARRPEAVEIDVTVGYGASGGDVPPAIMAAIRIMLNALYDQRDEPPLSARNLLAAHALHV